VDVDEVPGVEPVATLTDVWSAAPHAANVMLAPKATTHKGQAPRRVLGVAMALG
jgi:hypothetical protein